MELPEKDIGTKRDLARYRIETARSNLKSADILYHAGEYKSANNRAYYAIFHAINAVHALSGEAYKRHKDAILNHDIDMPGSLLSRFFRACLFIQSPPYRSYKYRCRWMPRWTHTRSGRPPGSLRAPHRRGSRSPCRCPR